MPKFSDYLLAKQNAAKAEGSLKNQMALQEEERTQLCNRLNKLDSEVRPFEIARNAANNSYRAYKSRLLHSWQINRDYRWPSATIYIAGGEAWWHRRGWLRVVGGFPAPITHKWTADLNLFSLLNEQGQFKQHDFGPPSNNSSDIDAEFEQYLHDSSRLLEGSGYIIVPNGADI